MAPATARIDLVSSHENRLLRVEVKVDDLKESVASLGCRLEVVAGQIEGLALGLARHGSKLDAIHSSTTTIEQQSAPAAAAQLTPAVETTAKKIGTLVGQFLLALLGGAGAALAAKFGLG